MEKKPMVYQVDNGNLPDYTIPRAASPHHYDTFPKTGDPSESTSPVVFNRHSSIKPPLLAVENEDEDGNSISYEDSFEDLEWKADSFISKILLAIQQGVSSSIKATTSKANIPLFTFFLLLLLYNAYLVTAIVYTMRNEKPILWCEGLGFLVIITGLVYWGLFYFHVIKPYFGSFFVNFVFKPVGNLWDKCWSILVFRVAFGAVLFGGLLTFLILDTKDNRRRLISAAGIPILVCIGVFISKHPSRIVWRHIFWGTGLQFVFGLLILRWDVGRDISSCISDKVKAFLDFTNAGSSFVYGYLAAGYDSSVAQYQPEAVPPVTPLDPPIVLNTIFAFQALSVIYFFSFCVAILYNLGAMTWVIVKMGWLLQITMGTTAAESMSASANIFLGMTEAPLVVKPFLKDMTNSELHSIMTGGFATIAGTVLGAFISFGISPSHLLSASFMSAPAALAFAKLLHPETKVSRTTSEKIYANSQNNKKGNILDAASEATSQAVFLVANIIASLIAITAFVAFLDAIINWFGVLVGFEELTFQWILGKIFYPFAFIIGIDPEEMEEVARLLGIKTVVNEFVAYTELAGNPNLSPRSRTIATYALCSFSNFSSMGIQLGGLGAMAPERRKDFARVIWRSFIAGNAAALMTACIAGALISDEGYKEKLL